MLQYFRQFELVSLEAQLCLSGVDSCFDGLASEEKDFDFYAEWSA